MPLPRPQPKAWTTHTIRLQFIATTNTIVFDPQLLVPVVTAMNAFFDAGKITFVYDPARDFVVEDNTLLDQDWELVDMGSLGNPEALPPTVDVTRFHDERQRVAAQHLGKLVVYISLGSYLEWQGAGGWAVRERGFHYSSTSAAYVATAAVYWRTPGGSIDPSTLGHEIGHNLHEFHTMFYMPRDRSWPQPISFEPPWTLGDGARARPCASSTATTRSCSTPRRIPAPNSLWRRTARPVAGQIPSMCR